MLKITDSFDDLKKYKNCGYFQFRIGDSPYHQSKDVPDLLGIYTFEKKTNESSEVVYIGKSGTLNQNGSFKNQFLKKRLNNKLIGIKRQQFFDQKLEDELFDTLIIHWFVTFDDNQQDLPSYIEAKLIQEYFEKYKCLPSWNNNF